MSYGQVLTQYVHNPESKFLGPDGKQCTPWTRGILQRMHVIAGEHRYCGKEMKRKLEEGPVDHDVEFKCKVYTSGRVSLDDFVKKQIREIGVREVMRRGIGQHTIEKALRGTVRAKTRTKILEAIRR